MKRFVVMIVLIASIVACSQKDELKKKIGVSVRVFPSTLMMQTKSDNDLQNVATIDVLVFNNIGELLLHEKYKSLEAVSERPLELQTGEAEFCAIVNSTINLDNIYKRKELSETMVALADEDTQHVLMFGATRAYIQYAELVTIPVSALVARISLRSISVDFSGSPWEGEQLENTKVYLVNAIGESTIDGDAQMNNRIHHRSRYNNTIDAEHLVLEELGKIEDGKKHDTPHYFFSYEHPGSIDSELDKAIYLTVEAQIGGKTYYYPIPVNLGYYGEKPLQVTGVSKNSSYDYSLTIKNPGGDIADKPVDAVFSSPAIIINDWTYSFSAEIVI